MSENTETKNTTNTKSEIQSIAARGNNRSRQPANAEFKKFMGSNWAPRPSTLPEQLAAAKWTAARHAKISALFPTERIVIPAGNLKVRSNDTDYRFRPHSAFSHLTGLGTDQYPDAVLVIEPYDNAGSPGHKAILFFRPRASRQSEEFYANARYGELWVGVRPSLAEVSALTGIECRDIAELDAILASNLGPDSTHIRVVPQADEQIESKVFQLQKANGLDKNAQQDNNQLAEALSELRLRKDAYEVQEMEKAVAASKLGFEQIIRSLPQAIAHHRGERVVESAFADIARTEGNGVGYETIAASGNHANTLHWICNDGKVIPGDVILIDAGVEVDSLYTADVTRTLPVNGKFSPAQRAVYEAVLEAADAAFVTANTPGAKFKDLHNSAMRVIAKKLEQWGMIPVSAEESLAPNGQYHRRWMVHGTSHHLGLDVHDCAQARREMYTEAVIEPGMCFTIEPGLYFRADDLQVPEEFRGIGVRIEDDIIIDPDGSARRITDIFPRDPDEVEKWMASVQQNS